VVHPGILRTPLRTPRSELYDCWSGQVPCHDRRQGASRIHKGVATCFWCGRSRRCQTAGANTRLQRVASRDLGFPFHQEALCARLRHWETGRHGIAIDAGRDEAITPKRPMWPSPRLLRRSSAFTVAALCCVWSQREKVASSMTLISTVDGRHSLPNAICRVCRSDAACRDGPHRTR
jgi:hypothetical protein